MSVVLVRLGWRERECIEGIVEVGKEEAREEAEKEEPKRVEKKWKPPTHKKGPGGLTGGHPDRPNHRPKEAEAPGGLLGGPLTAPTTAQNRQKFQVV